MSYLQFKLFDALGWSMPVHETSKFRHLNLFVAAVLLSWTVFRVLLLVISNYDGKPGSRTPASTYKSNWVGTEINHAVLNICLFPPLFFFYGLYYTDVVSALLVLYAYRLHLERKRLNFVFVSLASLLFRQTNIFWVAVFLGGLEVIRTLPKGRLSVVFPEKSRFSDIIIGSWQHACVYDPLISQACFEGASPLQILFQSNG